MALARKRIGIGDAATLALWRVAESGKVDELAALLPRVTNINARNQHGVTALMRAAQHGHVEAVRLLLEHGADANIKRNDKFTALALAAFFGHTEVVRALMEHGADSQASTRSGTSPRMWATARTFDEVVDELEKPVVKANAVAQAKPVRFATKETLTTATATPKPPVVPAPPLSPTFQGVPTSLSAPASQGVRPSLASPTRSSVPEPPDAPRVRSAPAVVRTLKDPPEIWDLVHEVPRGFNARSAFLTRLQSMKSGFAFRAAAAVVLIGLAVVGVMVLRGVQARNERTVEPQSNITSPQKNIPQPAAQIPSAATAPAPIAPTTETPAAIVPEAVAPNVPDNNKPAAVNKLPARLRVASSSRVEPGARRVETNEVAPPIAASAEKPAPPTGAENTTKNQPSVPLSPQLISPVKSATPKAKVIQWP